MIDINDCIREVLEEADYRVVLKKVEGNWEFHYPDGDIDVWVADEHSNEGMIEPKVTFRRAVDEAGVIVPMYALPWAVLVPIHAKCRKLKYDPTFIFYEDEGGNPLGSISDAVEIPRYESARYERLTRVMNQANASSYNKCAKMADEDGVLEGYQACVELSKKEN